MAYFLQRLSKLVLDTLFPIECIGCKQEGIWLCGRCASSIPIETKELCFVCKGESRGGYTCFNCRRAFPLRYVIRTFNYDERVVNKGIRLAKYSYVKQILSHLAETATPFVRSAFDVLDLDPRAALFVSVPLHPRKFRERGFNQAEILARYFTDALGGKYMPLLARRRMTMPQADLDEDDRERNIKGAFRCALPDAVRGRAAVLVDDVATTGSTLAECARILKDAGAGEVGALVLAKG